MTIFEAIEHGDAERARELVADDPRVASARGDDGVSALLYACYWGRSDIVDALLGARSDIDVFEAAALGQTVRLRELLAADPELVSAWSPDGYTPLHLAAFFGHEAGARLLLEQGADVNAVARNTMAVQPLHSAAAAQERAIARALLDAGADPNARQQGGFVPLHAAGQNGDSELAQILLGRGADGAARTDDGRTAADFAAEAGHADLAQRLRE